MPHDLSRVRRPSLARLGLAATLIATVGAFSACSSGGSRGPKLEQVRTLELPGDDLARLGYRRDWAGFPFILAGQRIREIYPDTDGVFIQETGSTVSMFDVRTGQRLWNNTLAGPLTKFISIRRGIVKGSPVLLVTSESDVFALDPQTGNLLDRQNLRKVATSGPVVFGDLLIFGTSTGEVMAHLTRVSDKLWGSDLEGPIEYAPVRIGELVAAVARSGQIAFLEPTAGSLRGMARMHRGAGANPVAGDNLVFVPSLDQSLYAFDPYSGSQVWRLRTSQPITSQPVAHDGMLYIELAERGLCALAQTAPAHGSILWSNPDVRGTVIGMRSGRLLVWSGRELVSVSPANGTVFDRVTINGVAQLVTDNFVDGNLYAVGRGGSVVKLVPLR
ncbi:MAG: PQQ-binding-like beta-propeller repeat protein [Phycisphaeraceae bacterium]|nr:PQQ-binding-like beta-propeller repeat protein [Phycisphaeraceae bacterium]MCW5755016.1 PQQ-binding-like beta-propeller repeat protein [Phycisphaeraceae bacterium]